MRRRLLVGKVNNQWMSAEGEVIPGRTGGWERRLTKQLVACVRGGARCDVRLTQSIHQFCIFLWDSEHVTMRPPLNSLRRCFSRVCQFAMGGMEGHECGGRWLEFILKTEGTTSPSTCVVQNPPLLKQHLNQGWITRRRNFTERRTGRREDKNGETRIFFVSFKQK